MRNISSRNGRGIWYTASGTSFPNTSHNRRLRRPHPHRTNAYNVPPPIKTHFSGHNIRLRRGSNCSSCLRDGRRSEQRYCGRNGCIRRLACGFCWDRVWRQLNGESVDGIPFFCNLLWDNLLPGVSRGIQEIISKTDTFISRVREEHAPGPGRQLI
jgi:hypothetical protein